MIHELRTPLTTFRLYTDLLAERMVPAEEQPRYLETLRTEADRLGHLLENVLAFTRLERRGAPAAQRIALGPALREIVERLSPRAAAEGFELNLEVTPEAEMIEVEVDPTAPGADRPQPCPTTRVATAATTRRRGSRSRSPSAGATPSSAGATTGPGSPTAPDGASSAPFGAPTRSRPPPAGWAWAWPSRASSLAASAATCGWPTRPAQRAPSARPSSCSFRRRWLGLDAAGRSPLGSSYLILTGAIR